MTKEQILKENKKLQNKVKRIQKELEICKQKLEAALEDASYFKTIVTRQQEEQTRKEAQKTLSRKTCTHCHQRKATTTDNNNAPVCRHCFDRMARAFAHGW
jgi:membrane-bound lytic murein transglycosylase B